MENDWSIVEVEFVSNTSVMCDFFERLMSCIFKKMFHFRIYFIHESIIDMKGYYVVYSQKSSNTNIIFC